MRRFLSLLLTLTMMLTLFAAMFAVDVSAAKGGEKKRAIAIAFDNSGSMYSSTTSMEWCRAIYAMEVFATMMNDSDVMKIYPMWDITLGKNGGTAYSSSNPLEITQKNATTIREIYTPAPGGTPIETIGAAYNGLAATQADEKWLIVLTDGTYFHKGSSRLTTDRSKSELNKELSVARNGVNTMYLGIGEGAVIPDAVTGSYRYMADKASDSKDILSKLTMMCNTIFGRDTLKLSGNSVTFDVSMSKLIIFVQGNGISNVSLGSANPIKTNAPKYSEYGNGRYTTSNENIVDTSLQGVMLTYGAMDAGTYNLSYSGNATDVVAYYEPDVDLFVSLVDANGNPVDVNDDLMPGTYKIKYTLVDRDGNPTTSKLLGDTSYKITYTLNGKTETVPDNSAGEISFDMKADDTFDADFEVTYLNDYTIKRTGDDFGWPSFGFTITPRPADHLDVSISGGSASYSLSEFEKNAVYRINLNYGTELLTGAALDNATIEASLTGGNATYKVERDDQGYYVQLGYNGTLANTSAGAYSLTVSAAYTNEDGMTSNLAADTVNFEIAGAFDITLEGGAASYTLTELEEQAVYRISAYYGGELLTGDALNDVVIDVGLSGGNAKVENAPDGQGYTVSVKYNGAAIDTSAGAYTLAVNAYYNVDGTAQSNMDSAEAAFEIVDNSGDLTMTLTVEQDYYLMAELANGKPIIVNLRMKGEPLSDDQLNAMNLTWSECGLTLIKTPLAGQSAYEIKIDPECNPADAAYDITFMAEGQNEIGKDVFARESVRIEIRFLPLWLRILIPILIFLIIVAIIWFIMTRKVLPKKLRVSGVTFYVDGESIQGTVTPSFSGAGKKRGSISISTPRSFDPRAKAGLTISVEAVDCRYVPSSKRKMRVVAVSPSGKNGIKSYRVGVTNFSLDPLNANQFNQSGAKAGTFKPFNIGNNSAINISKSLDDGPSMNFSCKLIFPKK